MTAIPSPEVGIIQTRRILGHPPAAVYAAFADSRHLARWWGPLGFTSTFHTFDFRPGGRWEFVMHGPDGRDYANISEFRVLIPARKIVLEHISPPQFTLTVDFVPHPTGSTLKWSQAFPDPALAARLRALVVPANEQNLDRLSELLALETRDS
ncbi:MAG: SRPBCC domain-containing protein [Gemmatimonadaceae bacterium]